MSNLKKAFDYLLLFLFIMAGHTICFGQVTISANNTAIKQIILQIEKDNGYSFFYSDDALDLDREVTVNIQNESIEAALNKVFAGTNIRYAIGKDKQILLTTEPVAQASKKYFGIVTDANHEEPITGASIAVKGTRTATFTDVDGKFSIEAPAGSTLLITYIGYAPKEVRLGESADLRIVIREVVKSLDEVVVVGYGTMKKRDLTGAVSSIKMTDAPVQTFTNVGYALSGKAAGFQVTRTSAQVGGGSSFKIRGAASTGVGNDPLFIIDGFPVSSGGYLSLGGTAERYTAGTMDNILESINPNDIESIEVLKDASSTAIYGARAGHGVVIITTKRGKEGKINVSYSGNVTVQNARNTYKMLNGEEYMLEYNRFLHERWLRENGQDIYAGYLPTKPNPTPFIPSYNVIDIATAETTDWFGELTRPGVMQSHDLSVNGGTKNTKYAAALNYTDHAGVLKNNNMGRTTLRLNLDQNFSKYVSGGISMNLSRNTYDNIPLGSDKWQNAGLISAAVSFNPAIPIYDSEGNYSINPQLPTIPNPVSLLEITDVTNKERLFGQAFVDVTPVQDLTLRASFGIDRKFQKRKNYLPKTTRYGAGVNGSGFISEEDRNDYLMDLTATYIKQFGDHRLTALLGYSYQRFETEGFNTSNSDFITDAFLYNNLGAGAFEKPGVNSWASLSSLNSFFGRVSYSFLERYLLTTTLRADGASNFDPDNRWGYFPSVSAGWRFSEEPFLESLSTVLSNGKIRVSYGQTGNSNIGNRVLDLYDVNIWLSSFFGNSPHPAVIASQLGNKFLTWETTTEINIGLDLGFFNNRIGLTAEYFDRTISDLLSSKSLMFYYELTSTAANIGATRSTGVEITLNTQNIRTTDWHWTSDITFSTYNDRWKTRDPTWKPASYEKEDAPIRAFYSYEADGILQAGEPAPAHQPLLLPGQVKLKDLSGPDGVPDGKLDNYDVQLNGTWDPAFIFGLNNTLAYKNFDLNIYLYGEVNKIMGASYYDGWTFSGGSLDIGENVSAAIRETYGSDNLNTTRPSSYSSSYGNGNFYQKKISFIRVRNITLGYTVPLKKSIMDKLRVYIDINNPLVITNWTGIDPETDNGSYAYPNVLGVSVGVNVTF
ncbi:MAG: TonB-dependent receptor [Proteiniphilum sp.]|nr:TonB-dependent receptor [Proteiniphilum sp.]